MRFNFAKVTRQNIVVVSFPEAICDNVVSDDVSHDYVIIT